MASSVSSFSSSPTPSSSSNSANALGFSPPPVGPANPSGSSWLNAVSGLFGGSSSESSSSGGSWIQRIGEFLFPPAEEAAAPAPTSTAALKTSSNALGETQGVVYAITSAFEGGHAGSLQTYDSAYISYGMHQATLKNGPLGEVIHKYLSLSDSDVAKSLEHFVARIDSRDRTLAHSPYFLLLLKKAADEPEMAAAQNEIFGRNYWNPVVERLKTYNLKTPLAASLLYDTAIHGGIAQILNRVSADTAGKNVTEEQFLNAFLNERKEFLDTLILKKQKQKDYKAAHTYENSRDTRIGFYREQLQAKNFDLNGTFNILGNTVNGLPTKK